MPGKLPTYSGVELHVVPGSGAEPDSHMQRQLEKRLAALGRTAEVVDAGAERLPFPDASIDTAVATLVLCTISDLDVALAEITRVLKPEGRLLFLEHVRSNDPRTAAGRIASSAPGAGLDAAAIRTATRWRRSRPPSSRWQRWSVTACQRRRP